MYHAEVLAPDTPPILRKGSRGNDVQTLQQELVRQGYPIEVDGIFGTETESAVLMFQEDHELTPDGIVGPRTWEALHAVQGRPPVESRPPRRSPVNWGKWIGISLMVAGVLVGLGVVGVASTSTPARRNT